MIDMLLLLRLPHPHHFGYSFEIRFRVSPLRHWSILHSDFLADYCWAEDSWLMMLDSFFGCAFDIHTGAYLPLSPRFLVVFGLCGYPIHGYRDAWWILIGSLLCIRYPYWGIFPSPLRDLFGQWYEDGWLMSVVDLMTLISDLILGYISLFSLSILKIETVASLVLDWVLV